MAPSEIIWHSTKQSINGHIRLKRPLSKHEVFHAFKFNAFTQLAET